MKKLLILMLLSLFLVISCESDPCDICDYDERCVVVSADEQDPFDVLFGEGEVKCIPEDVECYSNSDCYTGQYCNEYNECQERYDKCEDVQCQIGYACLPSTGECVRKDDPCDGITCSGRGVCILESGFEARCACNDGYTAKGLICVKDACNTNSDCTGNQVCNLLNNNCEENSCNTIACSNNEICKVDNYNNPSCVCDGDFEMRNGVCVLTKSCEEISCSNHGTCSVINGAPQCGCDDGYKQENLECIVDLCFEVSCSGHGVCNDNNGDVQCACEDGFENDGLNCIPIDPCNGVTCSDHGVCNNNNGVAECVCNHGYSAQELECIENIHQSLRIELTWDKVGDLDLHLRKPGEDASAWGTDRDCFYSGCSSWYDESDYNPVFVMGDSVGTGPEIINIDKITPNSEPFTIAVHNKSNTNRPTATVKIYCNDMLNSQFTTVIPNYGTQSKSFWQVSNLVLTPENFCETSPLGLGDYPGED